MILKSTTFEEAIEGDSVWCMERGLPPSDDNNWNLALRELKDKVTKVGFQALFEKEYLCTFLSENGNKLNTHKLLD